METPALIFQGCIGDVQDTFYFEERRGISSTQVSARKESTLALTLVDPITKNGWNQSTCFIYP